MALVDLATDAHGGAGFHHEAFVYHSETEYLDYLQPFMADGLDAGDAILVAVPAGKVDVLQKGYRDVPEGQIRFEAMEDVGRNPAWILPVWAEFFEQARREGRAVRGIGEPIWRGRTTDELVECERHESLLNLVFAGASDFQLLCPYDATTLAPTVIAEAHRTHPQVSCATGVVESAEFVGQIPALLDLPLSAVPDTAARAAFDRNSLGAVRRWAADIANTAGLPGARIDDLMVAVSEGMTNSIRHGGGVGQLSVWRAGDEVLCEIRDNGQLDDPLAGRLAPSVHTLDGRGLWIMNRVCDLVQMRAVGGGQAVRLHFGV